jgi:hypothetical protein
LWIGVRACFIVTTILAKPAIPARRRCAQPADQESQRSTDRGSYWHEPFQRDAEQEAGERDQDQVERRVAWLVLARALPVEHGKVPT